MGGMLTTSKESEIIKYLRADNPKKLKDFLISHNIDSNELYTKRHRTLIQLCCYYGSSKCLSKLIEMNHDYNKKERSNDYSPLYIACKFNFLEIVKILLSQKDISLLQANNDNFNEFEISFLKGNYDICYYLLFEYKNTENKNNIKNENDDEINTNVKKDNGDNYENDIEINQNNPYQKFFYNPNFDLAKYISLQDTNQFPLFNMRLFYESLYNKVLPEECSSFAAEKKRTKDLLTKIPDPNETWGHFFKRLANMELYNPPLVDKKNVSQMNSLYMSTQMKLIENEYGIKMNYYYGEETKYVDNDQEEEKPIIKVENTEKKFLKEESQSLSSKKNLKDIYDNSNIINVNINKSKNKERKIDQPQIGSNNNMCVININNKSSDRQFKNTTSNEDEK